MLRAARMDVPARDSERPRSAEPTLTGRSIGPFRVVRRLEADDLATIYLVEREGGERALVRALHPHVQEDPDYLDALFDITARVMDLRAAHVLTLREVHRNLDGHAVLVYEHVEGESLSALLEASARGELALTPEISARVVMDALRGLEAAHSRGFVHYDVSPHRIWVGRDGVTRLRDLGLAKVDGRLTGTPGGRFRGRLGYLAPEQLRDVEIDGRADLFAAGVVLWEALAGERLFARVGQHETLRVISEAKAPRLADRAPALAEFDRVIARSITADRDARYETALEMSQALGLAARAAARIADRTEVAALVQKLSATRPPHRVGEMPPSTMVIEVREVEGDRSVPLGAARGDMVTARLKPLEMPTSWRASLGSGYWIALVAAAALLVAAASAWLLR